MTAIMSEVCTCNSTGFVTSAGQISSHDFFYVKGHLWINFFEIMKTK